MLVDIINVYNTINNLIKELYDVQEMSNKRRNDWANGKKEFLVEVLNEVVKAAKSDWYVSINDYMLNHETVYLTFGKRPSGIIDKENNEHLVYHGGSLFFSQSANGKIVIWVQLPYIDNILYNDNPIKVIATQEPTDLDEATIKSYIESFLEEMIKAEKRERERIGFKKE